MSQVRLLYRPTNRRLVTDTTSNAAWRVACPTKPEEGRRPFDRPGYVHRYTPAFHESGVEVVFAGHGRAACDDALQCADTAFAGQQLKGTEATRFTRQITLGRSEREPPGERTWTLLPVNAQTHSAICPCDRRTLCLRMVSFSNSLRHRCRVPAFAWCGGCLVRSRAPGR